MDLFLDKDINGNEFYNSSYLKQSQQIMLEMLKIVDEVAKQNNIGYWLDGGTLLGAVRHKGFIPWDDDIDICFLKDDYDKFLPLLHQQIKKQNHYKLMYYDHKSILHWEDFFVNCDVTIVDNGVKKPLRIDLIPMKLVENNKDELGNDSYMADLANFFVFGKTKYHPEIKNKYKFKTLKEALSTKRDFFESFLNQYMYKNFDIENKKDLLLNYPFNDIYVSRERDYYKYTDVFPLKETLFEGLYFSIPNKPENYLSILYGHYTELPPLKQRKPTHNSKIIINKKGNTNINESYIKYQNKYFYYAPKVYYKFFVLFRQLWSNGFKNVYNEIIKPFIKRKLK